MTYYIHVKNDEIIDYSNCKYLDCINIEATEEVCRKLEKYIYRNGEIIENPDYEAEQAKKERERIDMLSLTAADVERAIYKAKGIDFDDILELVKSNPEIDIKALKIELKANNFYRGNPYINQIGAMLEFTPQIFDEFFETNDYMKLLMVEETKEEATVET